jgi:predicted transcriptional regulator
MKIELIQKIMKEIELEKTGNPAQFSNQLNISERMMYKYISLLRVEFGVPISYCRKRKSYCFTEKGSLDLTWQEGV